MVRLKLDRVLRFIVVARELSFTRAATLLNIDQPWLSRQIIQLEEQLGFALFHRRGGRIRLTTDGEEFLRYAEKLAEASDELCERSDEMHRRHKLDLRIGAAYFTYWFEARTALLDEYRVLRPNVHTELVMSEVSEEVLRLMHAGTIDIGLVVGPVNDPRVDQLRIERGKTTLSIPPEDPLARNPVISLADLRGRRVAVGPRKNPTRHGALYGWIEASGAVPVEVPEGRGFMADMAERERLILMHLADAEKSPSSFVRRPVRDPKPRVGLFMVKRKGVASASVERFWRLGEEVAARWEERPCEVHDHQLALVG